jgi:serine/threonine-protein kinase
MGFLFSLLDNTYVLVALGLLAALIVYQKFAPSVRFTVPGLDLTPDDIIARLLGPRWGEAKLQRAVEREKKHGNFLAAGRMYEDAGKDQAAVDAFVAGQEYHAAASVLERTGKLERAAELYLQAGDFKKAAQVFTEAGKPAQAAELFLERKNTIEAARLFGVAQMWDRAAELYLKGGYPLRAAEAFEKSGAHRRAAECYEKHFDENVTYSTTYAATAQSADHKSALLAGRLFERAGDPQRAYQAYAKGNFFKEAAAACLQVGDAARAAELYMRGEDPERAAEAWERAGDPVKAANLRGEVALKADRVAEAAAHFQRGEDYLRSAELYESIGLLAEAAGAFEAGDSHAAAGGVYLRGGLKDRAAMAYARAGEHETAAKLFEELGDTRQAMELYAKAGLTFKSGEAAARAGEPQRAINLLQRVGAGDEHYRAAVELLARLFIETGDPALAIERLAKALGGEPVSPANLDLYYWLAAAHEAAGHNAEALALFKKIQAEDLSFRDVAARAARLQAAPAVSRPAPPPTVAAPAAPARPMVVAPPAVAPPSPAAVPSAAPARPAPGTARFVAREEIARGPLGVLKRGEETTGRIVALRLIAPELLATEGAGPALVADLRAASQVVHPNLVRVLGLVEIDGQRTLVSEWAPGRTLGEPLGANQRLPFAQAMTLARLLYQVLAAIHAKGLAHGSVQPSNVILASGSAKLSDFGTGRLRQRFPGAYRPAEGGFDAAGDLYAAAAVTYHALTGLNPKSLPQGAALPLPSTRAAGVTEGCDSLLLRALHPRVDLRPPSAEACLAALRPGGAA